ncbi:hypothetical protein CBR_g49004 [Chara braunii]|uniref:DNA methylase N-4/N-6 domain-containing protein n=1 Tax=Chara braunii TaxID=69332 RepID=A0A388M472_CHABU|nr:hypothetical protein CBR_g49004 [Chara braunii]|eukprot:GBG89295.1 hypothetical protein CBR_g49004 [Chara braunii]
MFDSTIVFSWTIVLNSTIVSDSTIVFDSTAGHDRVGLDDHVRLDGRARSCSTRRQGTIVFVSTTGHDRVRLDDHVGLDDRVRHNNSLGRRVRFDDRPDRRVRDDSCSGPLSCSTRWHSSSRRLWHDDSLDRRVRFDDRPDRRVRDDSYSGPLSCSTRRCSCRRVRHGSYQLKVPRGVMWLHLGLLVVSSPSDLADLGCSAVAARHVWALLFDIFTLWEEAKIKDVKMKKGTGGKKVKSLEVAESSASGSDTGKGEKGGRPVKKNKKNVCKERLSLMALNPLMYVSEKNEIVSEPADMPYKPLLGMVALNDALVVSILTEVKSGVLSLDEMNHKFTLLKVHLRIVATFVEGVGADGWEAVKEEFVVHTQEVMLSQYYKLYERNVKETPLAMQLYIVKALNYRDKLRQSGSREPIQFQFNDSDTRMTCWSHNAVVRKYTFAEDNEILCPYQKPIFLYEWLIKKFSDPNDSYIVDAYPGSGTGAIATLLCKRNVLVIESDLHCVRGVRARLAGRGFVESATKEKDSKSRTVSEGWRHA